MKKSVYTDVMFFVEFMNIMYIFNYIFMWKIN